MTAHSCTWDLKGSIIVCFFFFYYPELKRMSLDRMLIAPQKSLKQTNKQKQLAPCVKTKSKQTNAPLSFSSGLSCSLDFRREWIFSEAFAKVRQGSLVLYKRIQWNFSWSLVHQVGGGVFFKRVFSKYILKELQYLNILAEPTVEVSLCCKFGAIGPFKEKVIK